MSACGLVNKSYTQITRRTVKIELTLDDERRRVFFFFFSLRAIVVNLNFASLRLIVKEQRN